MRAVELVNLLSVEKSVRGAIQLATALKLPILAERFNDILEVSQPLTSKQILLLKC